MLLHPKLTIIMAATLFLVTSRCSEPQDSSELAGSRSCGTILAEFGGVAAYSNGEMTGTGHGCARDSDAIKYGTAYQCVELVARYFNVKYGAPYSRTCNAADCIRSFFSKNPDEFRVISNSTSIQPQSGDAIFFGGHPGHTGIITKVTERAITFMHQNAPRGEATVAFNDNGSIGSYGSLPFLGLVRHKKDPIQPVRDIPKSTNNSTPIVVSSEPAVPIQTPQPSAPQIKEPPKTTSPPPISVPTPTPSGPNCSVANVQHQTVSLWISNCISYGGSNTPDNCRGYCLGSCCTPLDAACRQACTEN